MRVCIPTLLGCCVLASLAACASESSDSVPEDLPIDLSVELVTYSLDSTQVFTVPQPGDPEWDDFMEMLDHPQHKSRLQGQPGYSKIYDPEWRAPIRGYRDVQPMEITLVNATTSVESVVKEVLAGIQLDDAGYLQALHVDETEFVGLVWPAMPQSRPITRIPSTEAWAGHLGHCNSGIRDLMTQLGGKELVLESIQTGERQEFPPNFNVIRDVVITALDPQANATVVIKAVSSIIEHDGQYKVFIYKD